MDNVFFKRIVVAVNGSQNSIRAAMYAILMAKSYNLDMKVVYVVDTATINYLSTNKFIISSEKQDFESSLTADGENYLKYIERIALTKGVKIDTELRSGGIFSEIIKAAEEYEADLILLGGNDKDSNGIQRNSISQAESEILLRSTVPVMVVQKPEIEKIFRLS